MKTVGIIGGLSPESTVKYYQWLNDGVKAHFDELGVGGNHSAKVILYAVDFGEFCALKEKGDWDTQADKLVEAAQSLERGGADFIVLATNTMHKMADQIEASVDVPFLHLADATADRIKTAGVETVGLLGTKYTMVEDFYTGRLRDGHGITTLVPDTPDEIDAVSRIIYEELTQGIVRDESRQVYRDVIQNLVDRGAKGIIMGCTEITMLIDQSDSPVPVFDTTRIHVEEALEMMFTDGVL